jgi:hypothetical protein
MQIEQTVDSSMHVVAITLKMNTPPPPPPGYPEARGPRGPAGPRAPSRDSRARVRSGRPAT